MKKRLGLVGLGKQGLEHLSVHHQAAHGEIVAAYDVNIKKLTDFDVNVTDSLESLLDESLDGVILAIPHHHYYETLKKIWSIAPGMPVGKEKPLGRNIAEANAILMMAQQTKAPLQVFIQRRFHSTYAFLRECIQQSAHRPKFIDLEINLGFTRSSDSTDSSWRSDRKLTGGGALMDLGYHLIDLAMYLVGDFEVVGCTLWENDRLIQANNVDDKACVMGIHDDTWLHLNTRVYKEYVGAQERYTKSEQVSVYYDDYCLVADREKVIRLTTVADQVEEKRTVLYEGQKAWTDAMVRQIDDFCLAIDKGYNLDVSIIWDQQPVQSIIETAYQLSTFWSANE